MKLTGLDILLTYQCTLECDHCFVWGSPWQTGTMTVEDAAEVLRQAAELGSIRQVYFEGGEPFLFYGLLLPAARLAREHGFNVGIVSNAYWATSPADARQWLAPLAGIVDRILLSSDVYHWGEKQSAQSRNAVAAGRELGIRMSVSSVAQPQAQAPEAIGQLAGGESAVMYRGRAAQNLASRAKGRPASGFTACPHEDLREPGRVHVDPFGNVHLCQGIIIGNVFRTRLRAICEGYSPDDHPVAGPLLAGGPLELARRYGLSHGRSYADACHLCYETRRALRARLPDVLGPDQMYCAA